MSEERRLFNISPLKKKNKLIPDARQSLSESEKIRISKILASSDKVQLGEYRKELYQIMKDKKSNPEVIVYAATLLDHIDARGIEIR